MAIRLNHVALVGASDRTCPNKTDMEADFEASAKPEESSQRHARAVN